MHSTRFENPHVSEKRGLSADDRAGSLHAHRPGPWEALAVTLMLSLESFAESQT